MLLLHFSVIQYIPDASIGLKVFQIMFEFFLPKRSLQNWQKKSIFFGTMGNHILGFWSQCKKCQPSRSFRLKNTSFWMSPYLPSNNQLFILTIWYLPFDDNRYSMVRQGRQSQQTVLKPGAPPGVYGAKKSSGKYKEFQKKLKKD